MITDTAPTPRGKADGTGIHGVDRSPDGELLATLWRHRAAGAVVTRNGHTAQIRAFLAAHGAPPELPVVHVPKGESKLAAVRRGLRDEELALLVDDSVAELTDAALAAMPTVHRVLFVRTLL